MRNSLQTKPTTGNMTHINKRKAKGWLALASSMVGLSLALGSEPWSGRLFVLASGMLALNPALTKGE
jgi:hypothetical protein